MLGTRNSLDGYSLLALLGIKEIKAVNKARVRHKNLSMELLQ
jgi:hypothetical protein